MDRRKSTEDEINSEGILKFLVWVVAAYVIVHAINKEAPDIFWKFGFPCFCGLGGFLFVANFGKKIRAAFLAWRGKKNGAKNGQVQGQ